MDATKETRERAWALLESLDALIAKERNPEKLLHLKRARGSVNTLTKL